MTFIFWLVMAVVVWYGYTEHEREECARKIQNDNNNKMEEIP